jgi:histidyl-tRNA synthetase
MDWAIFSMSQPLQSLPGFRDFSPRDCAVRNYVFETWRSTAARYGFSEWEGPLLESTDLYRRKSGEEIVGQLFHFTDKGEREVALRPELTPTLARVVAARHREFKKPLKWFQIGSCFRYEAPQKGRLREFYQWNADILGEASTEADAELIALGIDALRMFGFGPAEVAVRVSDRTLWDSFVASEKIDPAQTPAFLSIIDKFQREKPAVLDTRLRALGTTHGAVEAFIEHTRSASQHFQPLLESLGARGLGDFVRIDPGIVRGLAYYTGTVFEFFSLERGLRAVAGGGRYDQLCGLMSDGAVDLPAAGFAMGDVVLGDLIQQTPAARRQLEAWLGHTCVIDAYVVVADETKRPVAVQMAQRLREAGWRADLALGPAKVAKQFQTAEALGARVAVIAGSEFPAVKIKDLAQRTEQVVEGAGWLERVRAIIGSPREREGDAG